MVPEQRFFRFPQCYTKRKEKKSQDSKNSEKDRKGRNRYNQQRNKKNNDSRSRSRSNNQHNSHKFSTIKSIKNDEKEWLALAEGSKEERRKKGPFFRKIRPYNQRQEERFETADIKSYGESKTNNNEEQNEHNHNCARYARCSEQSS